MEELMLKNLFIGLMSVTLATSVFAAAANSDQTGTKPVTIPSARTTPVNGKQMYASYCAQCHGLNGKGNGPVASSMKTPPPDLTLLSKNNGGKFPGAHVSTVIESGTIASHGTSAMPVWGPVLGNMDGGNALTKQLRITNLTHYLESMQAK
jgi:mono/diheme cytochrome c family protein